MNDQRRRTLLKAAVASVALPVAGCSEDSDGTDESPATNSEQTPNSNDGTEDSSEGERDETDEDEADGDREQIAVGNNPYTRWIPEPASAADGTVDSLLFLYIDGAALRAVEEALPESGRGSIPRENALPLIQRGPVKEILRVRSPLQEPDFSVVGSTNIYLGAFDKDQVVDAYASTDQADWDSQTEYEGYTLFRLEQQNGNPGATLAVGESAVLYVPQIVENGGTEITETFIDAGAGRVEPVHQLDTDIARLYGHIEGSTFVNFTYGDQHITADDAPEELLGAIVATTVGESETEQRKVYPFTDESRAVAARDNERFPQEGYRSEGDVSETVDENRYLVTRTIPTAEYEGFS